MSRVFVEGAGRYNYLRIENGVSSSKPDRVSGRRFSDYFVSWRAGVGVVLQVADRFDAVVTASWRWAEFETTFSQRALSDTDYSLNFSGPEVSIRIRRSL